MSQHDPTPEMDIDPAVSELYARSLEVNRPSDRARCVPPERLEMLVRREGDEETRLGDLDHISSCAPCREDFELLRAVADAEKEEPAEDPISLEDRRRPRRVWLPVALAASIVGAIGIGVITRATPGEPVLRGAAPAVQLLVPAGTVDAGAVDRLVWSAAGVDATYEVQLVDPGGETLFTSTTTDTVVVLPAGVTVPPGQALQVLLASRTLREGRTVYPAFEFRTR